jgi:hypothetical protein
MRARTVARMLEESVSARRSSMSVIDKLKGMMKGHESQAHQVVEKAGDMVDRKTQNKYQNQVDMVQKKLDEEIDSPATDQPRPDQP